MYFENIFHSSRDCQIKDWPSHKKKCSKVKYKTERNTAMEGAVSQSIILEEKKKVEENHSNSSEDVNNEKQLVQDKEYFQNIDKKQESFLDNAKILSSSSKKELEAKNLPKENCTSTRDINLSINTNDESEIVSQMNGDIVSIFIKHNKEKKKVEIAKNPDDSNSTFQQISDFLRIPVGKLKLIHKGKMVVPENVNTFLTHGALFLAFGEVCECEDGLDKTDIDILIKQLNVDRNVAVKALKQTGTLLDAIFDIGNKL